MKHFLEKVAELLLNNPEGMQNTCVVFPNRRSGIFLKRYLQSSIDKPVFLPSIITIQDFVAELSDYQLADELSLFTDLYHSYINIKGDETLSFEDILKWAPRLLQDFDEIDQHLADARYIFSYLHEDKNLMLWSLDKNNLSTFQQNYLSFFSMLFDLYQEFSKRLHEKKQAGYGMMCKNAWENCSGGSKNVAYLKIIFAGFNAFNKAEFEIVKHFQALGRAEILWNADSYYINNLHQEAGAHLRKYFEMENQENIRWIENCILNEEKEIIVVPVPGNIAQVKFVASEINNLVQSGTDYDDISIILNDENLLFPVLNSIPGSVGEFNVTMGYSLENTPFFTLISDVFLLHKNAEKFSKLKNSDESLFYFRDISKIINHPYIKKIIGTKDSMNLNKKIVETRRVFYTGEDVSVLFKSCSNITELPGMVFKSWSGNVSVALKALLGIIELLRKSQEGVGAVEMEFLFAFNKILKKMSDFISEGKIVFTISSISFFLNQLIKQTKIPFTGEPYQGLQVMGMLETRTLPFETVFLLSTNEGMIPKNKSYHSFIPLNIRKESFLPIYKDQDQIYAYHFYQLLQNSKKLYLVYNSLPDDLGGGDRSRFISQLLFELPQYNPRISISFREVNLPAKPNENLPVVISKNKEITDKLKKIACSGFSPSALNTFRKCSLKYYWRYIAQFIEPESFGENIDNIEFGNHLHEILKNIYSDYKHKPLTSIEFEKIRTQSQVIIDQYFQQLQAGGERILSGKNILIYHVICQYVDQYIQSHEKEVAGLNNKGISVEIFSIEEALEKTLRISFSESPVVIKGKPDRIDLLGNIFRIIDFKTGNIESVKLNFNDFLENTEHHKFDYCFQLAVYAWLLSGCTEGDGNAISAALLGLRSARKDLNYLKFSAPKEDQKDMGVISIDDFMAIESSIKQILELLFNPAVDFKQTSLPENCEHCEYTDICRK